MFSIRLDEINNWINPLNIPNIIENENIQIYIPEIKTKIIGKISNIEINKYIISITVEFQNKGELTFETTNFHTIEKLGLIEYFDYQNKNVDEFHIILNDIKEPLRKWWNYIDLFKRYTKRNKSLY